MNSDRTLTLFPDNSIVNQNLFFVVVFLLYYNGLNLLCLFRSKNTKQIEDLVTETHSQLKNEKVFQFAIKLCPQFQQTIKEAQLFLYAHTHIYILVLFINKYSPNNFFIKSKFSSKLMIPGFYYFLWNAKA